MATFLAVIAAWVFFRAENFTTAVKILSAMTGLHGFSFSAAGIEFKLANAVILVVFFLGVVWLFPNSHEILAAHKPALEYARDPAGVGLAPTPKWIGARLAWQPNVAWALLLAAIMVSAILNLSRPSEFIYWQF
jgi:hypothetical protein